MNKTIIGCVIVGLSLAVSGFAEEAACDSSAMAQVLQRLDSIEKRLDKLEDQIGNHMPGSESMADIYVDVKRLKTDIRNVEKQTDRVASDLRRLELRR